MHYCLDEGGHFRISKMSESKQRQFHPPELKAKVGLEAIRGTKTINEIGLEFGAH